MIILTACFYECCRRSSSYWGISKYGNGTDAGHVRIYEWDGTSWIQLGQDIDGEAAGDNRWSVSMNATGDRLAVGAPYHGGDAGHEIYYWNGTLWTQQELD